MESAPKKKKVVRAKSNKIGPGKKQVIPKKGNATQKSTKGPKAGKKENPTPKNIKPANKERNEVPVVQKSVKSGLKKIETNKKQGVAPKAKKLNRPQFHPNKTGPTKTETQALTLTLEITPNNQVDEKHVKASVMKKNQFDFLLKNNENPENKILMGMTSAITHVKKSEQDIMKHRNRFLTNENQDSVEMRDEEDQNEGDYGEMSGDDLNKTENISPKKNLDMKNQDMGTPSYSENSLLEAFKLAMNDKVLLNLLRDQLDASSSDDSTTGMSSSSNPGVLIWEVQSSDKFDGNQSRAEEGSKVLLKDETPVRDCDQDERSSLNKEILEELLKAFDDSPDIPETTTQTNVDADLVKDQETNEEQTRSCVNETEDYQIQDKFPIENILSDNNCGVKLQGTHDLVNLLDESDNFFSATVKEVFKVRENEIEEGNDTKVEKEIDLATRSDVEGYQPLLKFPTISPSTVNNQPEDKNEKEYLVKLKSDIESSPSGGILAMSKYFVDILSLHKYLRYFNRNQFFKE
ncbi:hypothetical protein WDU94_003906 [Cyamophila willieti]